MTDDPASWPDWRPPTEFPSVGVTVLVTVRDETGSEWIDFGERLPGGQWRIDDRIAMENDTLEVVAWMPVPPPADPAPRLAQPGSIVRCWCGTEGCLMPGEHLASECHTLAMMEAVEEGLCGLVADIDQQIREVRRGVSDDPGAEARETVKAKSYPTKEVKNQASDPKGKT